MTESNSPTTDWEKLYEGCPLCGAKLETSIGSHDYTTHFTYKCHTKVHVGLYRTAEDTHIQDYCQWIKKKIQARNAQGRATPD